VFLHNMYQIEGVVYGKYHTLVIAQYAVFILSLAIGSVIVVKHFLERNHMQKKLKTG